MFDFIKIAITDLKFANDIMNNPSLDFYTKINDKTGELKDGVYEAEYQKNMVFTVYPSGRVQVEGSIHKHLNDGNHNYNDFRLTDVAAVLLDLQNRFNIDPAKAIVHNIELGVNLITSFNPNAFINKLVAYKNDPFNKLKVTGKGNGRDVYFEQYRVKIYNKGLQYTRPDNILRVEKKIYRMECLGWGNVYLSDLTDPKFANYCLGELIDCFDNVTLMEAVNKPKMSRVELKTFERCINPLNWKLMTPNQRCTNRAKFKSIIENYGTEKLQAKVRGLLIEKGGALINIPEQKSVCSDSLVIGTKDTYFLPQYSPYKPLSFHQ